MKKKKAERIESLPLETYTVDYEGKKLKYSVQEPTFTQVSSAMAECMDMSGKLNMGAAGKAIWELCCTEFDDEIEKNVRLLHTVCIDIYSTYVAPVDAEIKKN